MRQRIRSSLLVHATQILAILASLATLAGIVYLLVNPPLPNAGETVSWWGIARNLERGYGYSLCNQYYFPFCSSDNSATAMREAAPVLLFAGVARLTGESLIAASVMELLLYVGEIGRAHV